MVLSESPQLLSQAPKQMVIYKKYYFVFKDNFITFI